MPVVSSDTWCCMPACLPGSVSEGAEKRQRKRERKGWRWGSLGKRQRWFSNAHFFLLLCLSLPVCLFQTEAAADEPLPSLATNPPCKRLQMSKSRAGSGKRDIIKQVQPRRKSFTFSLHSLTMPIQRKKNKKTPAWSNCPLCQVQVISSPLQLRRSSLKEDGPSYN